MCMPQVKAQNYNQKDSATVSDHEQCFVAQVVLLYHKWFTMEINVIPPRGKCFSVGLRVPKLGDIAISTAPCTALVNLIES